MVPPTRKLGLFKRTGVCVCVCIYICIYIYIFPSEMYVEKCVSVFDRSYDMKPEKDVGQVT